MQYRLQRPRGVHGRQRHGLTPPLDRHASALGVDCGDHAPRTDRLGEGRGEGKIRHARPEERRPDNHVRRPGVEDGPRAFDRADPAAHAARPRGAHVADQPVVAAGPDGRVEVDELELREGRKACDPLVQVGILEREALPLDQLHDLAAAQVD